MLVIPRMEKLNEDGAFPFNKVFLGLVSGSCGSQGWGWNRCLSYYD